MKSKLEPHIQTAPALRHHHYSQRRLYRYPHAEYSTLYHLPYLPIVFATTTRYRLWCRLCPRRCVTV